MDDEEPLTGGNVSEVVRVGATVRRSTGPWTPAVHALLQHLERAGFDGAPRVLGIDERGREVLTFVPGQVGWPDPERAGRRIREFHDAVASFVAPTAAQWQRFGWTPDEVEIIGHNDLAPYNTVIMPRGELAFIDWDFAAPTTRMWDLAYALRTFCLLLHDDGLRSLGVATGFDRRDRIRAFADGYGLHGSERTELVGLSIVRLRAHADELEARAARDEQPWAAHVALGHLDADRRDLVYMSEHRDEWTATLK